MPLERITPDFLRDLRHPLVLHVSHAFNTKSYDHYVVCLRSEGDRVRVFDPPGRVDSVSVDQILSRSDGIGMLVSSHPISGAEITRASLHRISLISIAAFALAFGFAFVAPRRRSLVSGRGITTAIKQGGGIVLLSCVVGLLGNYFGANGIFHSTARAAVAAAPANSTIDRQTLNSLRQTQNALLIDARYPSAYAAGHIPGSINIPVDASDGQRQDLIAKYALDHPIIVYCESRDCPFSDMVAAAIRLDGFRRVYVYRGGWHDWSNH